MILFPAIDIKQGKCVRLIQGRAEDQTIYGDDPAAMARRWASEGAEYLHVVDLDGAFTGTAANLEAVERIVRAVSIPVQLGGGIRCMEDVERRLELGVARCILGSAAISDPAFAKRAAQKYPGRIVAGIDAKDGKVAAKGWVEQSDVTPEELGVRLVDMGIGIAVYTDISRDGMLTGPNIEATLALQNQTGMQVIASGGVSCLADIKALKQVGAYGVITGKAIYDGRLNVKEALAFC